MLYDNERVSRNDSTEFPTIPAPYYFLFLEILYIRREAEIEISNGEKLSVSEEREKQRCKKRRNLKEELNGTRNLEEEGIFQDKILLLLVPREQSLPSNKVISN